MDLDQSKRGFRQRYPVIAAVLGSWPVTLRLARHLPPAVDDVRGLHGGDLAGPLAGEQDQLQRRVEPRPQQLDLGIGEHALAVAGRIAVDALHGLTVMISCLTAHVKIARRRGQHLVGDDGRLDPDHHRADVGTA